MTPPLFIAKIQGGKEWFMAVKLAVLKSGEDVVADIKELCDEQDNVCLLYTSPSPRDYAASRMPSSA